jgi:hypothetical protein
MQTVSRKRETLTSIKQRTRFLGDIAMYSRRHGLIVALVHAAETRAVRRLQVCDTRVSAWAVDNEIALGQRKVDEKSNEITAIPELLKMLAAGN